MADLVTEDISVATRGSVAVFTLNRSKALNALTGAMRQTIADTVPRLARDPMIYAVILQSTSTKAFCSGSDVREILALDARSHDDAMAAFASEYRMNWLLECFSKPTISLINGLVMGGGVGITAYNTHRIAGENYSWAMPETAIGFFPDVGIAHFLARLGPLGQYLGLTGRQIRRADAYKFGLASHCIDSVHFAQIETELSLANPVDPLLDGLHQDPGLGELDAYAHVIEDCFGAPTVAEIIARLSGVQGVERDWALAVAADLRKRSPLALVVTHRHINAARGMDIRSTLEADYRLAGAFLRDGDFREGVRAALIDKDGAPRWSSGRVEEVTESAVKSYLSPESSGLDLSSREEMQRSRV